MREFLVSVLGDYVPVSYETIVDGSSVSIIPAGLAGVDWLYVLSGVLLILCVWSVFKLLGGLICKIS